MSSETDESPTGETDAITIEMLTPMQRWTCIALYDLDQANCEPSGLDVINHVETLFGRRLSPGTVYPMLSDLRESDYATRRPSLFDLGSHVNELTLAGREAIHQHLSAKISLYEEVLHNEVSQ